MLAFLSLFFIALLSICFKLCTKKSDKDLMRGHQVVADPFFFSRSALGETLYGCQHVQYGNQNYLNNLSQPWANCVRKAHAQLLLPTIPRHMYPYHLEERIDTL